MQRKKSHSLGGSVLAEQTVLGFSRHPPSPGGSPVLPSAVCQGRGGESRFAMAHKTQLQLNLGVKPNHANLATNFTPSHPSPVTIERKPLETIGLSHTPVQEFRAVSTSKLAMAMKLAKRRVRTTSAPDVRNVVCDDDDEDNDSENTDEPGDAGKPEPHSFGLVRTPPRRRDQGHLVREHTRRVPESNGRELGKLQWEMDKRMKRLDTAEVSKKPAMKRPGAGGPSKKLAGVRWVQSGPDVRVVNDRICWDNLDEPEEREQQRRGEQWARNTRLVYDLSQQVKGLQKHMHKKTQKNTQDAQSLIVQKLAAAQRAALRTLQGFSQCGRALLPIPPELTLLIQQLGLLSSQLGGGVNTEMNKNLEQIMVTMDNQESFQPEPSIPPQPPEDTAAVAGNKCNSVRKKKRMLPGGVLFTPLRHQRRLNKDSTHFTDSTFNSARRQQPLVPCEDCSPEVQQHHTPWRGTPRFCHVHLSPADFKSTTGKKKPSKLHPWSSPGILGASYHPKVARNRTSLSRHSTKPAGKKKQVSRQQKKGKQVKDGGETGFITRLVDRLCSDEEPETSAAELSSAIANQAKQLQELRKEISQKLADLKGGHIRGEGPGMSAAELSLAIANQAKQLQELRMDLSQKLADLKDRHMRGEKTVQVPHNVTATDFYVPPCTSPPQFTAPPHCTNSGLASMLKRLEELEAEEDTIRQRWKTIAYEDPLVSRPVVICQRGGPQEKAGAQEDGHQGGRAEQTGTEGSQAQKGGAQGDRGQMGGLQGVGGAFQKDGVTGQNGAQGRTATAHTLTSLPVLPSESSANIQQYRRRYEQHLGTPGQSKLGPATVPWKVAESIADDILGEVIEGVAGEMELLCDNFVEELYDHEFIRPP